MSRTTQRSRSEFAGARRPANPVVYLLGHAQVAVSSLGRLARAPLATLMTAAVIGIALSLPIGLHVLLDNLQRLGGAWDGAASLSLFLNSDLDDTRAEQLAERLRTDPEVESLEIIGRDAALAEFRRMSGIGGAIEALDNNPLPIVISLQPRTEAATPERAHALVDRFSALDEVEFTQLDLQWVRRFHAITRIAQRGVLVVGGLLGLAVLLIVGNTIRLEIQNRHAEIEITKLVGGTDAFIRRPFLYCGAWYGLFGGLIAASLVIASLWLLQGPVAHLADLYQSEFGLSAIDPGSALLLLGASMLLGWAGSWLAVGRHLSDIEPS